MRSLYFFITFTSLLFSTSKMNAQEDDSDFNDPKRIEIAFDSKDPDKGIFSLVNEFKRQNITISISNIVRNKNNKITAIDIVMKSDKGETKELHINRKKPIKGIMLYVDKVEKPDWDFGLKELDYEVNK